MDLLYDHVYNIKETEFYKSVQNIISKQHPVKKCTRKDYNYDRLKSFTSTRGGSRVWMWACESHAQPPSPKIACTQLRPTKIGFVRSKIHVDEK